MAIMAGEMIKHVDSGARKHLKESQPSALNSLQTLERCLAVFGGKLRISSKEAKPFMMYENQPSIFI